MNFVFKLHLNIVNVWYKNNNKAILLLCNVHVYLFLECNKIELSSRFFLHPTVDFFIAFFMRISSSLFNQSQKFLYSPRFHFVDNLSNVFVMVLEFV